MVMLIWATKNLWGNIYFAVDGTSARIEIHCMVCNFLFGYDLIKYLASQKGLFYFLKEILNFQ